MSPAQNPSEPQPSEPTPAKKEHPNNPASEAQNLARSPALVKPVIFRYTCRGALYLDDEKTDTSAQSVLGRSAQFDGASVSSSLATPRCVGIESRLRKVRDLPRTSREDAIVDFIRRSAVADVGPDADWGQSLARNGDGGRRGGTSATAVFDPPGGDRPRLGPAAALPVGPDAADYGEGEDVDDDDGVGRRAKRRLSGAVRVGGEEEDLDGDYFSSLSCYGTTQVSVLMLRDSKKAEVAAVAPENTLGVTVRDEGDSQRGSLTTTLRMGPLEVTVGNQYEFETEGEEEVAAEEALGNNAREQGRSSVRGKREDGMRPTSWPPGVLEEEGRVRKKQEKDGIRPLREGLPSDRTRIRREEPSSDPEEDFSKRFLRNLNRTAEAMKNNAKILSNEVNDDFPNRVMRSGERVVGQFGKTLERTKKVAKDVYRMWWSDDDDE